MSRDAVIRRIHNSGKQFVLAFTGGGSGAIADLLRVPGGSRSVLEARVPYAQAALQDLLGSQPEQFCSDRTARAMAMACWLRAQSLASETNPHDLIGLGCTASLASDRPKKGTHRAYLAFQTAQCTVSASVELCRDARNRAEEEDLVAAIALSLVAEAAGLIDRFECSLLPDESAQRQAIEAPAAWQDLMQGRVQRVQFGNRSAIPPRVVFPGAFNPLHSGHREMADLAGVRLGAPVEFEISIQNVDKLPLDYIELDCRTRQFRDAGLALWLTRAPTFVEKSRHFPGVTFVVGVDTMARIGQPRYYGGDPDRSDAALAEIAANGCRFLVFPRVDRGKLLGLDDLDLPATLRHLCEGISASEFRNDASSTDLRQTGAEH